jgi:hypothetical protein
VVSAVGVTVLLAVALADIVIVVLPTEEIVVPTGMPAPEITWPAARPATLDTPEMVVLPDVTNPVKFVPGLELAVALVDIVRLVAAKLEIVVPAGMPAPLMGWLITIPVMLERFEMVLVPDVTTPVSESELLAVAGADKVMVDALLLNAEIVVPVGMPVPVMT